MQFAISLLISFSLIEFIYLKTNLHAHLNLDSTKFLMDLIIHERYECV